jgi:hypothetical protein
MNNVPGTELGLTRRLSPLVIMLAAGVGGCASNGTTPQAKNFTPEGRASMATTIIDPSYVQGGFTAETFIETGSEMNLEQQWVSEARVGTAQLEAQRAAAQASEVHAFANYDQAMAAQDANIENAFVARDTGYADAELLRATHDARLSQMDRNIAARGVHADSEFARQETFLSASVREWQAEVERMRSQAESGWQESLAEHERMLVTRDAVLNRGQAEIDQMLRATELTQTRAVEKVQALRTEAQSVAKQTDAEVEQLSQQIQTTQASTDARVSELTQQAHSLDDELASRIAELNAQADLLATADADHVYRLSVESAQVNYETNLADAENLRLAADELSQQNASKIAKLSADADARFSSAQTSYEEAQRAIQGQYSKLMAEVTRQLSEADEIENIGRSGFIKAETDARAEALREQAKHTVAIAKAEREKIEAEALAEARRLQAQFTKEFAAQTRKGNFTIFDNTKPVKNPTGSDQPAPDFTDGSERPAKVLPEHVAAFKTALAKATELRQRSEAGRMEAHAMRDAEMGRFNDWWNRKQAEHRNAAASIEAFSQKASAEVSGMVTRANASIAQAETERSRALVEADASRNEVYARITTLRGNSETLDKKKGAQVRQLLAQAESTRLTGASQITSLHVQRDATARRGQAKSRQLLAEASSLESSQRAIVAQMTEDIDAARQILAAELSRLDQGAASYIAVAQANFDEAKALADAFERIAVANAGELTARHIASRKQAEANIGYMRNLAKANELVRDADVARRIATADEQLGFSKAQDIAVRGAIDAQQQVALASVTRELNVADASESAVIAQFDSRVAQSIAERNRSYADLFRQGEQQRVRSEIASAEAAGYAELSLAALERLNATSSSFQKAAQRNWDSRLAMPTALPTPFGTEELFNSTSPDFIIPQFVTVPTDTE